MQKELGVGQDMQKVKQRLLFHLQEQFGFQLE
jgi:hypothetical protein